MIDVGESLPPLTSVSFLVSTTHRVFKPLVMALGGRTDDKQVSTISAVNHRGSLFRRVFFWEQSASNPHAESSALGI